MRYDSIHLLERFVIQFWFSEQCLKTFLSNLSNKCTTKQLVFENLTHAILTQHTWNQLTIHMWQPPNRLTNPQICVRLTPDWWDKAMLMMKFRYNCMLHHAYLWNIDSSMDESIKLFAEGLTDWRKKKMRVYLPMKDLDNVWGRAREINLAVVGLALIARNLTIWAELTKPYMSKIKVKFLFIQASHLKQIREGLTIS